AISSAAVITRLLTVSRTSSGSPAHSQLLAVAPASRWSATNRTASPVAPSIQCSDSRTMRSVITLVGKLVGRLFTAHAERAPSAAVIGWWESRRLPYNLIVGAIGLLT